MKSYADTDFLVSLYLNEATTTAANAAVQTVRQPLPLIPLGFLSFGAPSIWQYLENKSAKLLAQPLGEESSST